MPRVDQGGMDPGLSLLRGHPEAHDVTHYFPLHFSHQKNRIAILQGVQVFPSLKYGSPWAA